MLQAQSIEELSTEIENATMIISWWGIIGIALLLGGITAVIVWIHETRNNSNDYLPLEETSLSSISVALVAFIVMGIGFPGIKYSQVSGHKDELSTKLEENVEENYNIQEVEVSIGAISKHYDVEGIIQTGQGYDTIVESKIYYNTDERIAVFLQEDDSNTTVVSPSDGSAAEAYLEDTATDMSSMQE